jgi:hypothetical protein
VVSGRLAAVCAALGLLGASRLHAAAADKLPPLNDPPTADRLIGKFIWAQRFTSDPASRRSSTRAFLAGPEGRLPATFTRI